MLLVLSVATELGRVVERQNHDMEAMGSNPTTTKSFPSRMNLSTIENPL